jgi:hypothetical protein
MLVLAMEFSRVAARGSAGLNCAGAVALQP